MTDPEKAKHDHDPFEPTIDPSNGTEVSAGQDYTDVYGGTVSTSDGDSSALSPRSVQNPDDPDRLFTAYNAAPDLLPGPRPSAAGSGSPIAASQAWKVDLGAVRGLEGSLLSATSVMTDSYNDLRNKVVAASHSRTFFGQNDTYQQDVTPDTDPDTYSGGSDVQTQKDDLDGEGQEFANSIIPGMTQLMNAVAGAIEYLGVFNASLNNAAQIYAQSDSNSAFPETGSAGGKLPGTAVQTGDPVAKSSPGTPSPSHKPG
jgi:hypothetical protein